jgi:hypothetical protein
MIGWNRMQTFRSGSLGSPVRMSKVGVLAMKLDNLMA